MGLIVFAIMLLALAWTQTNYDPPEDARYVVEFGPETDEKALFIEEDEYLVFALEIEGSDDSYLRIADPDGEMVFYGDTAPENGDWGAVDKPTEEADGVTYIKISDDEKYLPGDNYSLRGRGTIYIVPDQAHGDICCCSLTIFLLFVTVGAVSLSNGIDKAKGRWRDPSQPSRHDQYGYPGAYGYPYYSGPPYYGGEQGYPPEYYQEGGQPGGEPDHYPTGTQGDPEHPLTGQDQTPYDEGYPTPDYQPYPPGPYSPPGQPPAYGPTPSRPPSQDEIEDFAVYPPSPTREPPSLEQSGSQADKGGGANQPIGELPYDHSSISGFDEYGKYKGDRLEPNEQDPQKAKK